METTKVVYNASYGSFGLSLPAEQLWKQRTGKDCLPEGLDIPRGDPDLVYVVETLEKAANGCTAKLKIREVPKGVRYIIHDYDSGGEEVKTEDDFNWFTA